MQRLAAVLGAAAADIMIMHCMYKHQHAVLRTRRLVAAASDHVLRTDRYPNPTAGSY